VNNSSLYFIHSNHTSARPAVHYQPSITAIIIQCPQSHQCNLLHTQCWNAKLPNVKFV